MTLPRRKTDAFKTGRCNRPIPKSLMSYDRKIPGRILVLDFNGVEARKAAIDRQERLEKHALAASDPNGGADATAPIPMARGLSESTATDNTTPTYLPDHNARAATVATARPSPSFEPLRDMHVLPATRDALGRDAPTPAQRRCGSLAIPSIVSYARKLRPKRPKKTAQVVVEHKSSIEAPRDSYPADASVNIFSTHTHPVSNRTAQLERPDNALLGGVRSSLSSLSPPTMPAGATAPSPTTYSPLKRRHDSDANHPYKNARARHFGKPEDVSRHLADKSYDLSAAEHARQVHACGVSSAAVTNSAIDYHTAAYFVNQPVSAEMTRQYSQGPSLTGYEVFERPTGSAAYGVHQTGILEQRDAEQRDYDGQHIASLQDIPGRALQEMVSRDEEPAFTLRTISSQSPNFVGDDPLQFAPSHSMELQHVYASVHQDSFYEPPHIAATGYQTCSNIMCGGTAPHHPGFAPTASPEPNEAIDTTLYEPGEVVNTGYSFIAPAPAPIQFPVYHHQDGILPSTGRPPSPQQPGRTPIAPDTSQTTAYCQASDDNLAGGFSQPGQVSVHDAGFGESELHARLAIDHPGSDKPFAPCYPGVDADMCAVPGHLQQEGGPYSGDGDTFPSQRETSYPQDLLETQVYPKSALWSSPVSPHAHLSGESVPLQFPIPTTPTYDFPVAYGHHPSVPAGVHGLVLDYESPSRPPLMVHGMLQPVQNHHDDIALRRRAVNPGGSITMCPAPPELVQNLAAIPVLEQDYDDFQLADVSPSHPASLGDDHWRGGLISAISRSFPNT